MRPLPSTRRYEAESGYALTSRTIALMAERFRDEVAHPQIRRRTLELFRGLEPRDFWSHLERVWAWILEHVRYQRDPWGVEHITGPVELDQQIDEGLAAEDCESMALYAATLLGAAGIPSAWETQGRDPSAPKEFQHCALQVFAPTGEGVSFDPVGAIFVPGFGLGDTYHAPGQPIEWWGLDGRPLRLEAGLLAGCFESGELGASPLDIIAGAAQVVGKILPVLGPTGAIIGHVLAEGGKILDARTRQPVGTPITHDQAEAMRRGAARAAITGKPAAPSTSPGGAAAAPLPPSPAASSAAPLAAAGTGLLLAWVLLL